MADRLKYYDPVLEKTMDDQQQQQLGAEEGAGDNALNSQHQMEEQKWLQNLRQMAEQYKMDYSTSMSTIAPPAAVVAPMVVENQQQQHNIDPSYNYQQQQIDQQFMEINKQFSELNLQYQGQQSQDQQQQPTFYNPDLMQPTQSQIPSDLQQQQPMSLDPYQNQNDMPANDIQQPLESSSQPNTIPQQDPYQSQQQVNYMQPDVQQGYMQNYYDPSQQQQQQQQQQYINNDGVLDGQQQQQTTDNSYDYWSQQQQTNYGSDEVSFV